MDTSKGRRRAHELAADGFVERLVFVIGKWINGLIELLEYPLSGRDGGPHQHLDLF